MSDQQTMEAAAPKRVVSVVIPSHNCLDYLPHAIDTILSEGIDGTEIVVVDDNSSDGTWEWLGEMRRKYPGGSPSVPLLRRLRLPGVGPAPARNVGIAMTSGDFVAFLDADDEFRDGKLAKQIAFHRANPEVVFSFTDYMHFREMPEKVDSTTCFDYWKSFGAFARKHEGYTIIDDALPMLFAENVVGTSTVVVRKDALQNAKGFESDLEAGEDWDLWLRLAKMGPVGFTPEVGTGYLVRPGSITSKRLMRMQYLEMLYKRFAPEVKAKDPGAIKIADERMLAGWAEYYDDEGWHAKAMFAYIKLALSDKQFGSVHAALRSLKLLVLKKLGFGG